VRQSLRTAAEPKFTEPEELSACSGAGATRGAMVGDQSQRKARSKVIVVQDRSELTRLIEFA